MSAPQAIDRTKWVEVFVVLCIAFAGNLVGAFLGVFGSPAARGFWDETAGLIWQSVQIIVVVAFVMWRAEGFKHFGISIPRLRDFGIGTLAALLAIFAGAAAMWLAWLLLKGTPYGAPATYEFASSKAEGWQFGVVLLMLFANSMAEEIGMRSFLITRFKELFGTDSSAVLLSSLLFASYHFYQGAYGFVNAFGTGIVFGIVFLRYRSFWSLVIAHTLVNILSFYGAAAR